MISLFKKGFTDTLKFAPFVASFIQLGGIIVIYTSIVSIMASGKRTRLVAPSKFPNSEYQDLYIQPYLFNLIPILMIILLVFL